MGMCHGLIGNVERGELVHQRTSCVARIYFHGARRMLPEKSLETSVLLGRGAAARVKTLAGHTLVYR